MTLNITILFGSYRKPSLGKRVVKYISKQAQSMGHNVKVVDAQEIGIPLIEKRYVDYAPGTAPKYLEDLKDLFQNKTDAFILVSGEYNGTLQPGLKNLIDHFFVEYFHRPSGLVMYSVSPLGGARAAETLRALCGIVGMPAIPNLLAVPVAQDALSEDGVPNDPKFNDKASAFLKELAWYGRALKREKAEGGPAA